MGFLKRLTYVLCAFALCIPVAAQQSQQQDSLIVLLSAKSTETVDVEGASYRQVIGPARFLHNGTFLLCDTALWNVETRIIEAWGNVSILQEETVLTSDKLTYVIDEDLAQFRGGVVQLTDKDHNTLRTRHLDYDTADSVAVFQNGGAMRDKDGQIIESRLGTYDSKIKTFTFDEDVNMFTDSIFVKTRNLKYESDLNLATFGRDTDAWQEENMLSSDAGWYDRGRELFFFTKRVHVMSQDQEGWCDSLYFHRMSSDVEMLGNAQVNDTTRNVFGLAGRIEYIDTTSKVTLTRKPAVISQTEEQDGSMDTLYLGADKLVYFTMKMCDIDSMAVVQSQERLKSLDVDPVGEFRKKAAEAAAKAAEEAAENDPNQRARKAAGAVKNSSGIQMPGAQQRKGAGQPARKVSAAPPIADSLTARPAEMPVDSLTSVADSLGAAADSPVVTDSLVIVPEVPKDTTKVGFLEAIGKVKIYKKNMQVVCDSLIYTDLDSLARLYKEPIIWQEEVRQYTADSVTVVISNGSMEKASLMSNAFITIQEDTAHYDQIKGAEMLGYFDSKGALKRFDVLGGASALFYLEENDELATVNKAESKMLSATFQDGEIQRIYYFEEAKNDGYPVVQLAREERLLKGFSWQPDKRPADRNAVTPLSLRPSERSRYAARPRAKFKQTDIYFPGYMNDVYRQIEVRDSLRAVREREREIAEREAAAQARIDSLALADSLMFADSLALADSLAIADSLALSDSLAIATDSLAVFADSLAAVDSIASLLLLTPEEQKAAEKSAMKAERDKAKAEARAAREAKKKAKQEAREKRWAELDKKDADKAAAKEAKRLEKERRKKRKALEEAARQAEKDAQVLESYRIKYEQKKAKSAARSSARSSDKRK